MGIDPHSLRAASAEHACLTRYLVAACFAALALTGPARAWVVDVQSAVSFSGSEKYAGDVEVVRLPVVDVAPKIPVGAIGCVGVCVGLEAEASGHADIEARFAVGFQSFFDLASKANARTFIFGAGTEPAVGTPFYLVNRIDPLGIKKLDVHTGNFDSFAGLDVDIGGTARAEACLVLCLKASLKLNADFIVPLAGASASGLKVFGSLVDSSAPLSYTDPAGVASAGAKIPTFKATYANLAPGATATGAPMQEEVLGLKMDVAALIAKTAGIQIPLEGDLLGFDYTILSLDAFAALDLRHSFAFKVLELETVYQFSSPVQVFDEATQSWGPAITSLTLGDYESVQLRNLGATSLGISRSYDLKYRADFGYDLVLDAGLDLAALGIAGHGLHLGPLIDPDPWKINLGTFNIDTGAKTGTIASKGSTSTLAFSPLVFDPGAGTVIDACAAIPGGCQQAGYVSVRLDLGDGTYTEATYRVTNFGVAGCGPNSILDCDVDPDFAPIVRQIRPGPSRVGDAVGFDPALLDPALLAALRAAGFDPAAIPGAMHLGEYAADFGALQAFLDALPLEPGEQSSGERLRGRLAALGVDLANPFPPFVLGPGAPPLTEPVTEARSASIELIVVPEPSVLALLWIAAASLVLALRRRRFPRRARD
jgi:hypothetical protein